MMQRRPSAGASGHAACSRPFARRRSAGALDPAPARSHARAHARALTVTSLRASSSRRSRVRAVRPSAPSLPGRSRVHGGSLSPAAAAAVGESIVSPDAEARRELGARAGREGGEEDGHREKGARRQGERAGGRRRHQARRRRGARGGGEEGGEEGGGEDPREGGGRVRARQGHPPARHLHRPRPARLLRGPDARVLRPVRGRHEAPSEPQQEDGREQALRVRRVQAPGGGRHRRRGHGPSCSSSASSRCG